MLNQEHYRRLEGVLPFLAQAGPDIQRQVRESAYHFRIPSGHDVFVEDDHVNGIALLISGVVRVYKIGETGREITLYRFGLGESCILTANAILSRQTFPAIATVEEEAEAVMVEAETFRSWVNDYAPWRTFVFDLLAQRLAMVMTTVEEVAFRRLDARIAEFLVARSRVQNPVLITHQQIAAELGSSREVISRLLVDFATAGYIRAGRGAITIINLQGLQKRAAM